MVDYPVGPPRDGDDGIGRPPKKIMHNGIQKQSQKRLPVDFVRLLAAIAAKYGPIHLTREELRTGGAVRRSDEQDTGAIMIWVDRTANKHGTERCCCICGKSIGAESLQQTVLPPFHRECLGEMPASMQETVTRLRRGPSVL